MKRQRIDLRDSFISALTKVAEGVPGAARVLADLSVRYPHADPENFYKQWYPAIFFDQEDITGSKVWILYKDLLGESYSKMMVLMRAVQLGILLGSDLRMMVLECIDGKRKFVEGGSFDAERFDMILESVKIDVPSFVYDPDMDRLDWTVEDAVNTDPKESGDGNDV